MFKISKILLPRILALSSLVNIVEYEKPKYLYSLAAPSRSLL